MDSARPPVIGGSVKLLAQNIHCELGGKSILNGIDFLASAGQLSCIVGPNGSGKSTLIKAICGDLDCRGSIKLNGRDISSYRSDELAAIRGVLSQSYTLAFPFTVGEVVRLGLRECAAADNTTAVTAALTKVGLEKYVSQFYQSLSGGEQQRVQLARVLAQVGMPTRRCEPRWLVLDEPVASLDLKYQLQVMKIARDFARAGGGVVAVMHDLNLTALFADHVLVMRRGVALAAGPTARVLNDEVLSDAYNTAIQVNQVPNTDACFVLPHSSLPQ